ncbi:SAM-dependent methyltransferase [Helicobacter cetorum]|uniref:SAM-dependent methyltransferase n=1 Tax=Helicobacter cetorum (strain ATCC BAA-429 / MIT 00-7128) TaxID=182217 RepID=I0EMM0_HELC0|nr:SAM-dependent methyltransferase [Helicobacter cetorum]AFI04189.1 hypothetical protein HCW_04610 [Helicobacter cetorum MIT 00-7128]
MRSFGNYMQDWLYGKKGYYRKAIVGKKGDFYTSVSSSKFFGGTIAFYILKLLEQEKLSLPLKVIEIGAHYGECLLDVAKFLDTLGIEVVSKCEFISIEPLEELQQIQQSLFKDSFHFYATTLKDLHISKQDNVFVFSNELFDAFACEIIKDNQMLFVDEKHMGVWDKIDEPTSELLATLKIKEGHIPLDLHSFFKELFERLNKAHQWMFLSFDYGDEKPRKDMHLRAYKEHRVLDFQDILNNLSNLYQQSDLTYDVDFSLIRSIVESGGGHFSFYKTQAQALLDMGLMELLELFSQSVGYEKYLKEVAKVKPLISPGALGERFKAIEFVKKASEFQ